MKINIKNIRVKSICATLFISLFLSCNNGIEELQKQRDSILSISNLRQGFLDIFSSFGDMITDTLGIKADTKKEDIGKYFTAIEKTMTSVKEKLQAEVSKNGNYEKVRTVVDKFITETLDKIAEGAKTAASGATGVGVIGNAVKNEVAVAANEISVNTLVKGINQIVEVVLKDKGDSTATKTASTEQKSIGKLLSGQQGTDGTDAEAAAASASIGAVTGADILKAIAISGNADSNNSTIEKAKNAASIAIAKVENSKTLNAVNKDAVIAAGIALRAMAKDGKFSAKNEDKAEHAVNGAVSSAVNKTLSTLIIAIRNTVDSGLKTISKALAAVKQEDESTDATVSGQ